MENECPPELSIPCSSSLDRTYTTAFVFPANDKSSSAYACQEYCRNGCCYLFNADARVDLTSGRSIAGWSLLGAAVVIGIIMSVLSRGTSAKLAMSVMGTFVALGLCLATSMILLQLQQEQNVESGVSWAFPLQSASLMSLVISCALAIVLIFVVCKTLRKDNVDFQDILKFDNALNAATALVALISVCIIPLVGGWDGVSGIAFADEGEKDQTFLQNRTKYEKLISQQETLIGIVVSFITKSIAGILFKLIF